MQRYKLLLVFLFFAWSAARAQWHMESSGTTADLRGIDNVGGGVAWAAAKTWITVGPNGTDISTDDGRNWRALHPDPALHEAPDADRDWNALSLPFVVGPHGRIGKLNPQALEESKNSK